MYSGKKMKDFIGHENAVRCTALSNDDTLLVSGSDDKTIKVWDVRNGQHIRTLSGHKNNVMGCCLTYDDRFVISGIQAQWVTLTFFSIWVFSIFENDGKGKKQLMGIPKGNLQKVEKPWKEILMEKQKG